VSSGTTPRLRAHHFGPAADEVGGMATVLSTLAEHRIGADEVTLHATWSMHSRARTAALAAGALGTILRLPRDAIVHVHLSERGSFVREGALVLAARRRGLRTAVTLHGADFVAFTDERRGLVSRVLRGAHLITALSSDYVALVESLAPASTTAVVPNPVLVDPPEAAGAQTPPAALFTGEIGVRKGVDVLLRAWPQVRDGLPEATLTLVGPGTDLVVDPQPGLTVLAPVEQRRVRELVRAARLVVLPSRAEALPMTLLESMACARPFISTPVGGIASLADGGRLVPVGDDAALAGALLELLRDRDAADDLGRRGRDACAATRGVDVVDRRLRELYTALPVSGRASAAR